MPNNIWLCRCCAVGGVCTWWREVVLLNDLNDLNLSRLPLFCQVLLFGWCGSVCCRCCCDCGDSGGTDR